MVEQQIDMAHVLRDVEWLRLGHSIHFDPDRGVMYLLNILDDTPPIIRGVMEEAMFMEYITFSYKVADYSQILKK